ncbi:hypothetical protein SteCoe_1374 [Stentor coeruleus]|uniref:Uncharacterized protein n=1 Tax=Stentor coeruleus TaxID=5963 RepID=A0A1R2D220_9CILI|nr:hypothetical protein SteCoe_1374 [Stentor coeruleus]
MLKLLSRPFVESRINATLRMLNLTPKPSETIEKHSPSVPQEPKKKVKFLLTSDNKGSSYSNEKLLQEFESLPSTEHNLPLEFQEREDQYNETIKILLEKSKARDDYIKGMVTIPEEGKHYFIKEKIDENDGFHSVQIRSYISTMMRNKKSEGSGVEYHKLPDSIFKNHDMNTIKFYPGKVSATGEIDLNHWSLWYLRNQPEDIAALQESDWEPLEMNKERISDAEEMILHDEINKNELVDKEQETGESTEISENLATEEGGSDELKDESGNRASGSDSLQCPMIDEFMDREYNFYEELRAKGMHVYLSKAGAKTTSFYSALESPDYLPPAPPVTSLDLVSLSNDIENWCLFRNVPHFYQKLKEYDKMEDSLFTDRPWIPVRLPSIINYYETLPNYYKSHRLVQAVVSCLERFHPRMSRKHKELLINQLCNLITPRNPQKYLFLQEYINLPDSDEEEGVKEEDEEQVEFEIDKETGMVTGLKQKKHEMSGSESSEDEDEDLAKKKEKKSAKKGKSKHESDEESDEDDKKKKKGKGKEAQGKGKKGKEEDDDDDDDDDEEEEEELEGYVEDENEFRPRVIKSFDTKEETALSPDEQLQMLLGESIETTDQDDYTFDIVDRNVDWFTMDLENPDGIIPSTLTFYDNKDGYWDHWIKEKRDRAGLPEISNRPYFKH